MRNSTHAAGAALAALGALALSPSLAAQSLPIGLEAHYVQSLVHSGGVQLRQTCELPMASTGHFLPGGFERMGAVVLRTADGQSKLQYLDSLSLWNTGDQHIVEIGTTDCAVLPGATASGLDALATIVPFGLTVHASNAAGDQIVPTASLLGWFNLERVFAFDMGSGLYEIHGYNAQNGTTQRTVYNVATNSFTAMSNYQAPLGLVGMASFECDASAGRELAYWTDTGWLVIKNASATTDLHSHFAAMAGAETRAAAVLRPMPGGDEILVWNNKQAESGKTLLRSFKGSTELPSLNMGTSLNVTSIDELDWDGDGDSEPVIGSSTGLPVFGAHAQVLIRTGDVVDYPNGSTDLAFSLIEGAFYDNSIPDLLMVGDVDDDGDVDFFALGEHHGTIQHFFNGSELDMRPDVDSSYSTYKAAKVTGGATIRLPDGYLESDGQDLRVRIFPRGSVSKSWEFASMWETVVTPPAGAVAGQLINISFSISITDTAGWHPQDFLLLYHVGMVETNGSGVIIDEEATGIFSFMAGDNSMTAIYNRKSREETGSEMGIPDDGETTTGRPPGDPAGGSGPPGNNPG